MNPKSSSGSRRAERSKQSARDCRIRKKLRYQYLEEMVNCREKGVFALRKELEQLKSWCVQIDGGEMPPEFVSYVTDLQKKLVDLNLLTVIPADDDSETNMAAGASSAAQSIQELTARASAGNNSLVQQLNASDASNLYYIIQLVSGSNPATASATGDASLMNDLPNTFTEAELDLLTQITAQDLTQLPEESQELEITEAIDDTELMNFNNENYTL